MINSRFVKIFQFFLFIILASTASIPAVGKIRDGKNYSIIGGHKNEKCLDASKIHLDANESEIRVKATRCHRKKNQLWKLRTLSKSQDGTILFTIHSAKDKSKCLDVSSSELKKRKKHPSIHLYPCHKRKNQRWHIHKINNFYAISSAADPNKCLDASKNALKKKKRDVHVKLARCHYRNNQLWELDLQKPHKHSYKYNANLRSPTEDKCVDKNSLLYKSGGNRCNKNTSLTFNSLTLDSDGKSMFVGPDNPITFTIDHKFSDRCDIDIHACIVKAELVFGHSRTPIDIEVNRDLYEIPITGSKKNRSSFGKLREGDKVALIITVGKYKFAKSIVWATNDYLQYEKDVSNKAFYYFDTNKIAPYVELNDSDNEDGIVTRSNGIKRIYHVLKLKRKESNESIISKDYYSAKKKIIADLIVVKDDVHNSPFSNEKLMQFFSSHQYNSAKVELLELFQGQYISKISFCADEYDWNSGDPKIARIMYTIKGDNQQEYTRVIGQYSIHECPIELQRVAFHYPDVSTEDRITDIKTYYASDGTLRWINPIYLDGESGEVKYDYNQYLPFDPKLHETYRHDSIGKEITTGFYTYSCQRPQIKNRVTKGDLCKYPTFHSTIASSEITLYTLKRDSDDYGGYFYYKDGKLFTGYEFGMQCMKGRCQYN